jgi:hypothetical protein
MLKSTFRSFPRRDNMGKKARFRWKDEVDRCRFHRSFLRRRRQTNVGGKLLEPKGRLFNRSLPQRNVKEREWRQLELRRGRQSRNLRCRPLPLSSNPSCYPTCQRLPLLNLLVLKLSLQRFWKIHCTFTVHCRLAVVLRLLILILHVMLSLQFPLPVPGTSCT